MRSLRIFYHLSFVLLLVLYSISADENVVEEYDEEYGDYVQKYFEVCDDATIQVEDLSMLCDSPGAYYYGSGKYRNSQTCALGDKGRIGVYFYISEELESEPYVTIKVADDGDAFYDEDGQLYGGNGEDIVLVQDQQLCSLNSITAQDGQECPAPGFYRIKMTGYLGSKDGSGNSYKAKAVVGFRSDPNIYQYDLGGANTDSCPGDTEAKYTYDEITKRVAGTIGSFLVTWGTLVFGIASVVLFACCIYSRMNNAYDDDLPFETADDDLLDGNYNHVIVMSGSKSLVDF